VHNKAINGRWNVSTMYTVWTVNRDEVREWEVLYINLVPEFCKGIITRHKHREGLFIIGGGHTIVECAQNPQSLLTGHWTPPKPFSKFVCYSHVWSFPDILKLGYWLRYVTCYCNNIIASTHGKRTAAPREHECYAGNRSLSDRSRMLCHCSMVCHLSNKSCYLGKRDVLPR